MGDDLQKVTDVEVVVEQGDRPEHHVQLGGRVGQHTDPQRRREVAAVSSRTTPSHSPTSRTSSDFRRRPLVGCLVF